MTNGLLPSFTDILNNVWILFSRGGWVVFVLLTIYILYKVYLNEIQTQYLESIDYTLLEIKPPKENPTSFYNAEQVFIQLHQLFDNFTFQEKYIEGRTVFRFAFEIISLGGKISYLVRIPTKQRDLIEAALYANFPSLEISEVRDYLEHFDYSPDDSKYDLFGVEFLLINDQSYPIRTYREFEGLKGPEMSDIVVDPLQPLLETFTKISEQEFYGLQYILEPMMDDSWHDDAEKEIEKILGTKEVIGPDGKKTQVKNDMMGVDEVVKEQVNSIKRKLGRPGFKTKIRLLHIGTAEKFNSDHKKLVLSPFRIFSSANFNGFRPTYGPKKDYRISKTLEAAYIDWWVKRRKKALFDGYKSRSNFIGEKTYILNSEELATIFHFPITLTPISQPVESLESKKVAPPANLPILDE
ncbi:MAG TPA: hypothetical protein PKD79_00665 [Candidatus Doudnabacteria bacterium]|nr:hypothetical protein [Candidatus Doudnabacteria bacterium]